MGLAQRQLGVRLLAIRDQLGISWYEGNPRHITPGQLFLLLGKVLFMLSKDLSFYTLLYFVLCDGRFLLTRGKKFPHSSNLLQPGENNLTTFPI